MQDAGRVNASEYDMVIQFVKNSQQVAPVPPIMQTQPLDWKRLSFEDRAKRCSNPVSAKLLETMAAKKSNLCVAIDVSKSSELVTLAESVGPFAFAVKTHVDILEDWTPGVVKCCHFTTFPHFHKIHLFRESSEKRCGDSETKLLGTFSAMWIRSRLLVENKCVLYSA